MRRGIRRRLAALSLFLFIGAMTFESARAQDTVTFVPLGDSYTIGQNVYGYERWPNQLAKRLIARGMKIALPDNPARSGWTSYDALKNELPVVKKLSPGLVTVLLGANDIVQGVSPELYRKRMAALLSASKSLQSAPKALIVVTVPDFSTTPYGAAFGSGRDLPGDIRLFNRIACEEARAIEAACVDIFELSRELNGQKDMLSEDGLHPSGAQYSRWVDLIEPVATRLLAARE